MFCDNAQTSETPYSAAFKVLRLDILFSDFFQVTSVVSLIDEDYLPTDGSAHVVSLQYLLDQQALCAATSNGNLLLWNVTFAQVGTIFGLPNFVSKIQLLLYFFDNKIDVFQNKTKNLHPYLMR